MDRTTTMNALLEAPRFTPAETAAKLGVSEATLANWRSQRKGRIAVRIGRVVYYYADDLEAYLQEERGKANADKKARTLVALPVQHSRARNTRVRRGYWPPKTTAKPPSATRGPNGSWLNRAAKLKPQKTSRRLRASSLAGAKTWSTGRRRARPNGSG